MKNVTDGSKKRAKEDGDEVAVSPPPLKRTIKSSTNPSSVASFFTPASQKPPERTKWHEVKQSMLIARFRPDASVERPAKRRKVASFDLDGTLISTLSGKVWAKDASDWKWWHVSVPGELRRLHKEGYQIIVFSNQGSISLKTDGKTPKSDRARNNTFKEKVTAILNQLELPVTVYAATEKDLNRKPRRGMWDEMLEDYDLDEQNGPDLEASFFVGDAAGRKNDGGKDDFAMSDRDFAANVGIAFHTPEEYFLKQAVQPFERTFEPSLYVHGDAAEALVAYEKTNEKDLVLLCGSPGSGKSTFYWTALQALGYERVNQDQLKTRDKCLSKAAEFLKQGKSVAVDNTNADVATRAHWVSLANKEAVPIRCVYLQSDAKISEHNDTVRALGGAIMNPEARTLLPKMAFTGFASRLQQPEVKEGFQDVTVRPFRFAGSDEQKAIWTRYWV